MQKSRTVPAPFERETLSLSLPLSPLPRQAASRSLSRLPLSQQRSRTPAPCPFLAEVRLFVPPRGARPGPSGGQRPGGGDGLETARRSAAVLLCRSPLSLPAALPLLSRRSRSSGEAPCPPCAARGLSGGQGAPREERRRRGRPRPAVPPALGADRAGETPPATGPSGPRPPAAAGHPQAGAAGRHRGVRAALGRPRARSGRRWRWRRGRRGGSWRPRAARGRGAGAGAGCPPAPCPWGWRAPSWARAATCCEAARGRGRRRCCWPPAAGGRRWRGRRWRRGRTGGAGPGRRGRRAPWPGRRGGGAGARGGDDSGRRA